jgi:diguanylate cyclase (GGDEF)-like protein
MINGRRGARRNGWLGRLGWLPSLGALLLVAGLLWLQLLQPLEQLAYQGLFQWRGPLAWDDRVVLVKIDAASLDQLGTFPWSRDRYTQLLNVLQTVPPNVVVFDLVFVEPSPADRLLAEAMRAHHQVVIASGTSEAAPNHTLASAAITVGHVLHTADQDGWVRQVPIWVDRRPSLGVASLQAYGLFAAVPAIPDNHASLWPNWIGPIAALPQYSFIDVLNGQVNRAALQNKIILVGVTAAGFNPLVTPFESSESASESASGVHLQATLLQNLLQQNLLRPLSGPGWGSLLLLSQGIWSYALHRLRMMAQLAGTGLLAVGWWGISVVALHQHYWLPVALPIVLWLSTSVLHWVWLNRQLAAKNQRLTHLANIDELTQVANRRAFEQYLQQEWQRSLREQQPISLILCDVDFFKEFNDGYGHLAGDQCLYQVAQTLRDSTKRPTDLIARYGGEEFAVILPNTNEDGAKQLTARILSQMRAQLIPHKDSAVSHYLTVSLGSVTIVPRAAIDWHELIDVADRGLYQAKAQGRDRACHTAMPELAPLLS